MNEKRVTGFVQEVKGNVEQGVGTLTGDVRTQVEGKVDQSLGRLQASYDEAKDRLTEAARASATLVGQAAKEVTDQASTVVRDAARQATHKATEIGDQIYATGARRTEALSRTVEEQPLAALLIAGAIGYGLSFLIHRR
ncbi:MAG TPA: CsbD family protein [Stellaceae bacterium]|nr:CsbD family protein [Stellaceae bacterium]